MNICIILEGSYPYVRGGVSTWVNGYIRALPEHEFILWTITDLESKQGQFAYNLPKNVVAVNEISLDTALKIRVRKNPKTRFSDRERESLAQLIRCGEPDWQVLLTLFSKQSRSPIEFFMSEEFLDILKEFCNDEYPYVGFVDMFWTIRSMFLPLLYLIGGSMPEADLYHSASTGYAGVLGALASKKFNKPFVLTEHGIYTREREEEILRSDWVVPYFKSLWISMFYMLSRLAYDSAHAVTTLYDRAGLIQQEIGCAADKCGIVRNGIFVDTFGAIPPKSSGDWVDIGAIVRIAPIKDIKTMIYTFSRLKQDFTKVRLHILGGIDDEEYHQECLDLIDYLDVKDISITGLVNIKEYMQQLDFTILTSLSEGQPLAILESLAARRPVVATDVGSCRELIEGRGDDFGHAGICVPPMHQTELLNALVDMCNNEEMRLTMGEVGYKRVKAFYEHEKMVADYQNIYQKAIKSWQESASS
ncbi:MAG: GT4 family glycosyltransferase PelF [Chloroflexota bacterium]|nr:GT4 family glycosyltransferase PelF [Chloroflexota bacterium]